ncbi:MAG: hypothetical protein EXR11_03680 [Rhodospirillaceae bacterium]|nr:hypothetical protein [Rhodospirillaceae bacterium]
MRPYRFSLAIAIVLGAFTAAYAQEYQTEEKDGPFAATVGNWDVKCVDVGCLLSKDFVIADPDHPIQDQANPEFATIAVTISRDGNRVGWVSFQVPPDARQDAGLFVRFATSVRDPSVPVGWRMELDSVLYKFMFDECDSDSCTARIERGIFPATDSSPELNLVEKFLNSNFVLLLFQREGEAFRAMEPLFPFKRAYKKLMEAELATPK